MVPVRYRDRQRYRRYQPPSPPAGTDHRYRYRYRPIRYRFRYQKFSTGTADSEYQGLYGTVPKETAPPPPPKSKKDFKGIVGGLLAKKGKRAQPSTSSSGTTKRNEHMFPCLGMLARQVLSVPVSTVAVKREFSAGGNILTDYRSCLNAKSLETLVCNQDWLLARRRAQ
ncbi:hypothetical protein DM860_010521 [Cuscuta australis]|uniref:HAT C-terminal dimerisation domain-containing protein n=1 Tax=Cuscuta australis TaxID=267555 RepID=A0A328E5T0_9ASTE|nr:hypothetical protein DM860_010521 [Cuscuta australis]